MLLLKREMLLMPRWEDDATYLRMKGYYGEKLYENFIQQPYVAAISAAGRYLPKLACFSAAAGWLHAVDPYHHQQQQEEFPHGHATQHLRS